MLFHVITHDRDHCTWYRGTPFTVSSLLNCIIQNHSIFCWPREPTCNKKIIPENNNPRLKICHVRNTFFKQIVTYRWTSSRRHWRQTWLIRWSATKAAISSTVSRGSLNTKHFVIIKKKRTICEMKSRDDHTISYRTPVVLAAKKKSQSLFFPQKRPRVQRGAVFYWNVA